MIPLPSGMRVWLAVGRTDMRRGMKGLALQVQQTLRRDPHAGDLYVFRGRRGRRPPGWWCRKGGSMGSASQTPFRVYVPAISTPWHADRNGVIVTQLVGKWEQLVGSFSNMATRGVTYRATAAQTVAPTKELSTSAWVAEGPAGRAAPESQRDLEHMP